MISEAPNHQRRARLSPNSTIPNTAYRIIIVQYDNIGILYSALHQALPLAKMKGDGRAWCEAIKVEDILNTIIKDYK